MNKAMLKNVLVTMATIALVFRVSQVKQIVTGEF